MTDHGTKDRQEFIRSESDKSDTYTSIRKKVKALRERMHKEGRALAGEEVLARKLKLTPFNTYVSVLNQPTKGKTK
jgi:hypothetical protein